MQGPKTWAELEARLSDRPVAPDDRAATSAERGRDGRAPGSTTANAGGDGPAFGRRRQPYQPVDASASTTDTPAAGTPRPVVPYAELHCHSNFSFLAGASHPEELVEEAQRLQLSALAITDHNGLYGVVRFAEAARAVGLPTIFGSDITVHDHRGSGQLVVLADGATGYANLSRALSLAQLSGSKGEPRCTLPLLADNARDGWWILTGDHRGIVPRALVDHGPQAALRELQRVIDAFGRHRVLVELWDHGEPLDSARNDALAELAARADVRCVATNNVHYATPARRRLATAMAAVGKRCSLNEMDPWLPAAASAHVRGGSEQMRRFARYPGVVEVAAEVGAQAAFDLSLVAPKLPPYPCPDGLDEMQFLRRLTEQGATRRYGERPRDGEDLSLRARAWRTIDHELRVIETLGFAGYFLVVWDIVQFCERADIYCQGRGSAANSAVCYSLGITKADAVSLGLLFERFLSPERDGPPDIDIDIESGRREEVIQYVFGRYGRHHTAQVANVITYRARSAVRDMARALGYAPGQQDAWAKQMDMWGRINAMAPQAGPDGRPEHDIPPLVLEMAMEIEDAPRHLGIHSGGMVICDRPVIEVCPVEWGRMRDRSVLQWDKDDCAAAGLVKFDLLGLGMLSALHGAVDLVREHTGVEIDLATLPQDDDVYAMLCRADTVGVFQIESRAQMATLPRLKPRR
ncbi:MAG: error-prone polymerase, partial [Actinomycetota bacterium]